MTRSPDSPGIVVPPPLLFLGGFLVGKALDVLLGLDRVSVPNAIGPALMLLGASIGLSGAITFLRHRTGILPHSSASLVVTSGPYRFTRNPMYLGLTLVYLGVATMRGSIGSLITLLPTLAVLHHVVIVREEAYLDAKFGADYQRYRSRVRRWL